MGADLGAEPFQVRTQGCICGCKHDAKSIVSQAFPIFYRANSVVHLAVYARTYGSVRTYTCKCTHVHCHVYDGKYVEKDWKA